MVPENEIVQKVLYNSFIPLLPTEIYCMSNMCQELL